LILILIPISFILFAPPQVLASPCSAHSSFNTKHLSTQRLSYNNVRYDIVIDRRISQADKNIKHQPQDKKYWEGEHNRDISTSCLRRCRWV